MCNPPVANRVPAWELAIVRQIVEAHGGKVGVESTVGTSGASSAGGGEASSGAGSGGSAGAPPSNGSTGSSSAGGGAAMIVAISRFKVYAAGADHLAARFRSRPRLVDLHEGFLGLEVLRSIGREPTFMLVTRWTMAGVCN